MRDVILSGLITPTSATSGYFHPTEGGSIEFTCRQQYRKTPGSILEYTGVWAEDKDGPSAHSPWIASGILDVVQDDNGYSLTMTINDLTPGQQESKVNRVAVCGRVSDPFDRKNGFLLGMIYVSTGKGTGAKFPTKIWGEMAMTEKILNKASFESQITMSFVGSVSFSEYQGRSYYSLNTSGYPALSLPLTSEYFNS